MGPVSDYNTCAAWHGTLVSICHKTSIDEAIGLTIKPCSISKSKISYMNDRVGDGDACQAGTAIVSITNYLSVLLLLNGRKVKP